MKTFTVASFNIGYNGMGICAVRPSEDLNKSTALNQAHSIYTVLSAVNVKYYV